MRSRRKLEINEMNVDLDNKFLTKESFHFVVLNSDGTSIDIGKKLNEKTTLGLSSKWEFDFLKIKSTNQNLIPSLQ